jgi:putative hydrolase of the HAD superfamily
MQMLAIARAMAALCASIDTLSDALSGAPENFTGSEMTVAGAPSCRRPALLLIDLDLCLLDPAEAGKELFEAAFDAIRRANAGHLDAMTLEAAIADCWRMPFDRVAALHGFTPPMRAAGDAAFAAIEVRGRWQGYGDLHLIDRLPRPRHLVTTGYARLQRSKIAAAGLADRFDGIHIDEVNGDHPGKQAIFGRLLRAAGCAPREAWVVGDNPHSELAAGRALGMTTVQTLRPGVERSAAVDHHVSGLAGLLALWSSSPPAAV